MDAIASSAAHPHPMTAAEAVAAAAATEGLTLARADNTSGFRLVYYHKKRNQYDATLKHNGKQLHLGSFPTPQVAALCVARWKRDHPATGEALAAAAYVQTVSAEEAAAETVAEAATVEASTVRHRVRRAAQRPLTAPGLPTISAVVQQTQTEMADAAPMMATAGGSGDATASSAAHPHPMTAAEAVAAAATEGLTLVRADNTSGFRNVSYHKQHNKYEAKLNHHKVNFGLTLFFRQALINSDLLLLA